MVEPIKPSEVTGKQQEALPDHVIETWNRMIAEAWNGSSATIMQNHAIKQLGGAGKGFAWLNIEDIFRKAGWIVEYDKPGFNETYEASFKFSKKRGN